MISFDIVPCTTNLNIEQRQHLCLLINEVYAVAEAGMWITSNSNTVDRTSLAEVEQLIAEKKFLIALSKDRIIGSVVIKKLDPQLAEFGMLVAHPHFRGIGLGRSLVAAAEDWGRLSGCTTMQLELLTPKDWIHPMKDFLHKWYLRLGYIPIRTESFETEYAHLSPYLATPCNFTLYHKTL